MRPLAEALNLSVRMEQDGWPSGPTDEYRECTRRLREEGVMPEEIAYVVGALAAMLADAPDGKRVLWAVLSDWPQPVEAVSS